MNDDLLRPTYVQDGKWLYVTAFGNVEVLPSTWDRIERSKRVKGRETTVSRRRAWKTIGRLCNRAAEQAWRKGRAFKVTR
jgi:hypothetical protein